MERISREALNIQIAGLIALRGTCKRLQVGAVIVRNNKIIATGYNGPGPGEEHCNNFMCNTDEPCKRAIHAEENAINNTVVLHDYTYKYKIYCTHQPCINCAKLIAEYYIKEVYYMHGYRDKAGIEFLKSRGIKVIRINEQGIPQD